MWLSFSQLNLLEASAEQHLALLARVQRVENPFTHKITFAPLAQTIHMNKHSGGAADCLMQGWVKHSCLWVEPFSKPRCASKAPKHQWV
jgi:hypothetical protein